MKRVTTHISLAAALVSLVGFSVVGTALATTYFGDSSDETVTGTPTHDDFYMGGGRDQISALDGNDFPVKGENGFDIVNGQGGDDDLRGGVGDDTLNSGGGSNLLAGEEDADDLDGESTTSFNNTLRGQSGWDLIDATNGDADIEVNGGDGHDTCLVGGNDPRTSCEIVNP